MLLDRFLKVNSQSNWAETSSERRDSAGASGDESDDDSYLRSTEAITAGADASLASGTISLTKMKDANEEERSSVRDQRCSIALSTFSYHVCVV